MFTRIPACVLLLMMLMLCVDVLRTVLPLMMLHEQQKKISSIFPRANSPCRASLPRPSALVSQQHRVHRGKARPVISIIRHMP